jgi:glycosyl transferase family 25
MQNIANQNPEISIIRIAQVEIDMPGLVTVPPVFSGNLPASDYFKIAQPHFFWKGQLLSPGEVGCTLAHVNAWRMIVNQGIPCIIIEEDIELKEEQLSTAKKLCAEIQTDFIHLGIHPQTERSVFLRGKKITICHGINIYLVDPSHKFFGSFAYFITPATAEKLLVFHKTILRKADDWDGFFRSYPIQPLHAPIFRHPNERGQIENERAQYRQPRRSMFLVAWFKEHLEKSKSNLLAALRGYRKITPMAPKK